MKESQSNYALIMAGGFGSRFWPTSTASFPKQFQDLTGCGIALLQQTVERLFFVERSRNTDFPLRSID